MFRILSNKAYNDHTSELFKRLKILKVKQINAFQITLHMYKHDNNSLPTCLNGMFQTNSTHHNYNTRNRNQLCTPKNTLVKTEHSIRFLGQQIWNVVPDHAKQSNTLPMFKAKLKTILIQNG